MKIPNTIKYQSFGGMMIFLSQVLTSFDDMIDGTASERLKNGRFF